MPTAPTPEPSSARTRPRKRCSPTVATTATATDQRGQSRDLNVTSTHILSFDVLRLNDTIRDIVTYRTSYLLGIGPRSFLPADRQGLVRLGRRRGVSAGEHGDDLRLLLERPWAWINSDGSRAIDQTQPQLQPRTSLVEIFLGYSNAIWDRTANCSPSKPRPLPDRPRRGGTNTPTPSSVIVGDGGSVWETGESGALNEAYADIMGALVEGRSGPSSGCSVKTPARGALRNWRTRAVNTEYGSYQVTYADRYTGHQDDGGEHLSSTIFSHAVYR